MSRLRVSAWICVSGTLLCILLLVGCPYDVIEENENDPIVHPSTEWIISAGPDEHAATIQQTTDGGYVVAGKTSSSMFMHRIDGVGNLLWTKDLGGVLAARVRQVRDGGYIVAGEMYSETKAAREMMYLVKLDGQGNVTWTRGFPESDATSCLDAWETADGGYVVRGGIKYARQTDVYLAKTNEDGSLRWTKHISVGNAAVPSLNQPLRYLEPFRAAATVLETAEGEYFIAGNTLAPVWPIWPRYGEFPITRPSVVSCGWLEKTDIAANFVWQNTFPGSKWEEIRGSLLAGDGGYVTMAMVDEGIYTGSNIFEAVRIRKLDEEGNTAWCRTFQQAHTFEANGFCRTEDGGYVAAGNVGFHEYYVQLVKVDENGHPLWTRRFGRDGQWGKGVAVEAIEGGGCVVVGEVHAKRMDGGYGICTYVVRIDADGNPL